VKFPFGNNYLNFFTDGLADECPSNGRANRNFAQIGVGFFGRDQRIFDDLTWSIKITELY